MLNKLGFNEIKELLKQECESSLGIEWVHKLEFSFKFDLIQRWLLQTLELLNILNDGQQFPLHKIFDLRAALKKLSIEGNYLSEQEFFELYKNCLNLQQCIQFIHARSEGLPQISVLIENLEIPHFAIKEITAIIDDKGFVKANASKKLFEFSMEITHLEKELKKKIQQTFKQAQTEGWSTEPNLTVRNGRLVIPILAEYKRKIKGLIHGESATGQTVFLEPSEAFEINNKIEDLQNEKSKEIIKILIVLSNSIMPIKEDLEKGLKALGILDFIRAKARFGKKIEANMPILLKEPVIRLFNAKHPLLFLNFKEQGKSVVPLNVEIDENNQLIILSGPNAGGKSVCLKTIALLQLMLQHGLLIPASSHSSIGIFKKIFLDMGDEQNIESDLSTYSAHLTSMKNIIENANQNVLVFIDEFGAGTDPKFGGPIAEAILEVLNKKKAKGLITTHYSNLKSFAAKTQGLQNASMLFDIQNLVPTFIFESGKPGSSYALEIANKIGLQKEVIELSKKKIGVERENLEQLLIQLEKDKQDIQILKTQLEIREAKLKSLTHEVEEKNNFIEENKKVVIRESKKEFEILIKQTNQKIENVIREIKESHADNEVTKTLREDLNIEIEKVKEIFNQSNLENLPTSTNSVSQEFKVGNWAKIKGSDAFGQIVNIKKEKIEILIGNIKSIVDKNKLEIISKAQIKNTSKGLSGNAKLLINSQMEFNPLLDLRGFRGEEAIQELEIFLDKSILMGSPQLKILHGIGDGILRKKIRAYLLKNIGFAKFKDEEQEFGGAGITIIELI